MKDRISLLSRRRFLAGMAATAGAGITAQQAQAAKPEFSKDSRIVIIGAGFAGVGAARFLKSKGFNVEIIEAQNRVGGRARSIDVNGRTVDLGAAWLHWGKQNPLTAIADKVGVKTINNDFNSGVIADLSKTPVQTTIYKEHPELKSAFESALTGPYLRWAAQSVIGMSAPNYNVKEIVAPVFKKLNDPLQSCVMTNLLETAAASSLEDIHIVEQIGYAGGDPFGAMEDEGESVLPADEKLLPAGMQNFVKVLAKGLNISMNEPVESIDWNTDKAIIKTGKRTIDADAVILTSSLGLLKSGRINFVKGMPKEHSKALDAFNMGLLNKVILHYPDGTEWSKDHNMLYFCHGSPVAFGVNLLRLYNTPVIAGLCGGQMSRAIETTPDAELVQSLHKAVQQTLGKKLPEPETYQVTRWGKNRWALGSYGVPNLKNTGHETKILRKPIGDRIFLAGEGTSAGQQATVNGAYFDGMRAAATISGYI